jgi:hypothetical protein
MVVQHLSGKDNVFLAGVSVKVSPQKILLGTELERSSVFGSFKKHVFDKVGDSGFVGTFMAASSINKKAQGGGSHVGEWFYKDTEAIGE